MKKFDNLENLTPKELRKLKMNLNNRLESYKRSDNPKELSKSHMLFGLEKVDCDALLLKIRQIEKNKSK